MISGLSYGHWGITVWTRNDARDYAPTATEFFPYPAGVRGPIDSAATEMLAIARGLELGAEIKGPFFAKADAEP